MQPLTLLGLGLLTFLAVIYIAGIIKASRMEDVKERENYIKELDQEIKAKEKALKQLTKKLDDKGYIGGDFTKWRSRSL